MEYLLHPNAREITPYKPGRPLEEIQREFGLTKVVKLASNENCFPVPPHVRRAMHEELTEVHRYPDSDNFAVRQKIALYNGVEIDETTVGAGTVEVIRMIIRAFLKPGEKVLTSEKTFSFYRIAVTEVAGTAAYIEAPMDSAMRFDLDQIGRRLTQEIKIIFITNPNNPTGTIISGSKIRDFILSLPEDKIIILDNAYQEYVDNPSDYLTGIPLIKEKKNLVVLRTFSKVYGLAGLRIGYAMAHRQMIEAINRIKAPFNVTRLAQRAAIASLESDEFKKKSVLHNRKQRQLLFDSLEQMGMNPVSSQANFILFFPKVSIAALNLGLLKEGVIVRPTDSFGIPEGIRVTVGRSEENRFFLKKLKKVLGEMDK